MHCDLLITSQITSSLVLVIVVLAYLMTEKQILPHTFSCPCHAKFIQWCPWMKYFYKVFRQYLVWSQCWIKILWNEWLHIRVICFELWIFVDELQHNVSAHWNIFGMSHCISVLFVLEFWTFLDELQHTASADWNICGMSDCILVLFVLEFWTFLDELQHTASAD